MSQLPDHLFVRSQPERFGVQLVDGELWMQGVPLRSIAQEVQTPTYVYNLEDIRSRYLRIAQALHGVDSLVAYAVKANSNLAILRTLAAMGCGADVVSGGEIQRALAAGIVADRIIFSGVAKRVDEIDFAPQKELDPVHPFAAFEQSCESSQFRRELRVFPEQGDGGAGCSVIYVK